MIINSNDDDSKHDTVSCVNEDTSFSHVTCKYKWLNINRLGDAVIEMHCMICKKYIKHLENHKIQGWHKVANSWASSVGCKHIINGNCSPICARHESSIVHTYSKILSETSKWKLSEIM